MISNEGNAKCTQLPLSVYVMDVNYSCGSCGYQLNLSSSNRETSIMDSKYEKSIKKGIIPFFTIDESKFDQIEQYRWTSFFKLKRSRDLSKSRFKLLCRKCGKHMGTAYHLPSSSWDGISDSKVYHIKLKTLQPAFYEDMGILV